MSYRTKMLILLVFASALPAIGVIVQYSATMKDSLRGTYGKVLVAKLGLLENRVATSYDTLFRAGLADNEYYEITTLRNVARYFGGALAKGEHFYILDRDGRVFESSLLPVGSVVPKEDGFHEALAQSGKAKGVRSAAFGKAAGGTERVVLAATSFSPWNLSLALSVDETLALAPLASALTHSSLAAFSLLAISALAAVAMAQRMTSPIALMARMVKSLEEGRLDTRCGLSRRDELGLLGRQLDSMADRIESLTAGLEARVRERTSELEESLAAINMMQDQLVQSEKLSALGQLSAGIAHELNTPIGAVLSSAENLERFFEEFSGVMQRILAMGTSCSLSFVELYDKALKKGSLLSGTPDRKTRKALQKKLEDLGVADSYQLAERIAHMGLPELVETHPDLFSQASCAELMEMTAECVAQARMAAVVKEAATKAQRVVQTMQVHLRQEENRPFEPVCVDTEIDSVLALMHGKLKNVTIEKRLGGVRVSGLEHQLGQVWMNLLSNAAHATNYAGTISIATFYEGGQTVVAIRDDGTGVPKEIQSRIFEPFFTTKKNGEGMGLGLDICKSIIEKHGGTISLESEPGSTTFYVRLPALPGAAC